MTPEERFMFDLEGYLVIKNVLTSRKSNSSMRLRMRHLCGITTIRTRIQRGEQVADRWGGCLRGRQRHRL